MVAVVGMLILTIISAFIIDVLATLMGLLTFGLYIGGFLPLLAVSVRRLHDLGKSGWMMLVMFIPFVGGILLLVWFVSDGEAANNAYGPVPTNTL
tara:strand:+ start:617 stop:901 length:285 start_codon:yes stop_codon:yes gene_type:complete